MPLREMRTFLIKNDKGEEEEIFDMYLSKGNLCLRLVDDSTTVFEIPSDDIEQFILAICLLLDMTSHDLRNISENLPE